ncbi:Protein ILITYHIA [Camellia lanceoleosa]|uniref:Protein ILITYHIA n=1 Tax=Camellia lanceoleosa TaxID=1840588 RepID=A0ACC0H743_9ERIC|nr:Protein ILITYHIA [Camellia lanceoleosa]
MNFQLALMHHCKPNWVCDVQVPMDHTNSKIGTDAPPCSTPNWTINISDVRTVKVSNISLATSEKDIKEFFSFFGDIYTFCKETETSQLAYVTFKESQGANTAMLLTGTLSIEFVEFNSWLSFYAVDLMKPDGTVILCNAKIDMFKGSMRLAVDKWGRVEVTEPASFTVKDDNNLSLLKLGVCIGLSEVMASAGKSQLLSFMDELIPTIRTALCDSMPEVRESAGLAFSMLYKALEDDETSDTALDGLKQILHVRTAAVLPHILPKLVHSPLSAFTAHALGALAEVAGPGLDFHREWVVSRLSALG